MSDIVKVVEEEFDDEGNLTRRITTSYAPEPVKIKAPDWLYPSTKVCDVWPYPSVTGQIITNPEKYTSWNGEQPSPRVDTIQFSGMGNGESTKFTGSVVGERLYAGVYHSHVVE